MTKANNSFYTYLPDKVSFTSQKGARLRSIYAPLCGTTSDSLKSSITPFLSGDIKVDKNHYVTKPASAEDLRFNLRNFYLFASNKNVCTLTDEGEHVDSTLYVGQLWHTLIKHHQKAGLQLQATNFIPVNGDSVEIMRVKVTNVSKKIVKFTPTACVPLFARALANKHDHEHVTSLLHRIKQAPEGIYVEPTMIFNEEGHHQTDDVYFVTGGAFPNERPQGTFPTPASFYGEGDCTCLPEAVIKNTKPSKLSEKDLQGQEAIGALRFKAASLKPGASKEYFLLIGVAKNLKSAKNIFSRYNSLTKCDRAFEASQKYWADKSSVVKFTKADENFNSWARWVVLQPILRRIFGCSFLPDHDYGKGGKGWRDIWQDLLSLILIEPKEVRGQLINNFAGVRIDGSNATIIGANPGEFVADRNSITRVWMDHGVWPLLTTGLYINYTGDYDILLKETTYFCDQHLFRSQKRNDKWKPTDGQCLKNLKGNIIKASVLEHLLVQTLVQFFNVGEHNIIRLESADWNDGLDMAFDRGESVAFTCVYGRNLLKIAQLLKDLAEKKNLTKIKIAKELMILLDTISGTSCDYNNPSAKQKILSKQYFKSVQPTISGQTVSVSIEKVIDDLQKKAKWIFGHVRKQEFISVNDKGRQYQWFNGYYDNSLKRVEGKSNGVVRMTLTGQVFPIMSGVASFQDIKETVKSVKAFLKDKTLGGVRLNTDFGMRNYMDLGRAFSFAYGTKENGAFFSHMAVMYAYALYSRGFVKDGYEVMDSIYKMSTDSSKAKIYPGIPEYFDSKGRGRYHYLTGAASWFVLTQLTQVFGVRGEEGDLILSPKLVKDEFDKNGSAQVECSFAGKNLTVIYGNDRKLDYEKYSIKDVLINDKAVSHERISSHQVRIKRSTLNRIKSKAIVKVTLG